MGCDPVLGAGYGGEPHLGEYAVEVFHDSGTVREGADDDVPIRRVNPGLGEEEHEDGEVEEGFGLGRVVEGQPNTPAPVVPRIIVKVSENVPRTFVGTPGNNEGNTNHGWIDLDFYLHHPIVAHNRWTT
jgi:hypothetical protein